MDLSKRIDPELAPSLEMMPADMVFNFSNLPVMREMAEKMFAEMAAQMPNVEGVETKDLAVPGPDNAPEVQVRVYTPNDCSRPAAGLLWIHGGGYIMGDYTLDDYSVRRMSVDTGCVCVSVNYRLAPENPFPVPVEDCYAALKWMVNNSDELGIDKERIAIGGGSAGGGLAAGLTLLARDRKEIDLAFQLLIYPMIDDRSITPSSHAVDDPRIWDRGKNIFAWKAYLGDSVKGDNVSPYAAASRARDLTGLPPTYIAVGELDLFLDENIEYAQRLLNAGVSTELHVYPRATHGFDSMITASVAKRFIEERNQAIIKALS
jgi:acetyl esterase/lipase